MSGTEPKQETRHWDLGHKRQVRTGGLNLTMSTACLKNYSGITEGSRVYAIQFHNAQDSAKLLDVQRTRET